jgi:hypothetical protein
MKIYTRRNAAVGYVTLKAIQRTLENKKRKRRNGLKVAAYVGLGIISAGILAAVLAVALKRRSGDSADDSGLDGESEIVGEYVTAPEPVPAT